MDQIHPYAYAILIRVATAVRGRIHIGDLPESAGFQSPDTSFLLDIAYVPDRLHNSNRVCLTLYSQANLRELEPFGYDPEIDNIKALQFIMASNSPMLKVLVARELARSGVPEFEALSADFIAELKGEKPEPPLDPRPLARLRELNHGG